jgi:hypothetical protein
MYEIFKPPTMDEAEHPLGIAVPQGKSPVFQAVQNQFRDRAARVVAQSGGFLVKEWRPKGRYRQGV